MDRNFLPRRWVMIDEVDVAPMIALHTARRRLCDALEDCADCLPDTDAVVRAAAVTAALGANLGEADRLFAAIAGIIPERIRQHHAADRLHAEDLYEALLAGSAQSDMLGYMMRCLFDGCRRAIDLQQMAMLWLAGNRLTAGARLALGQSLDGPRQPSPVG